MDIALVVSLVGMGISLLVLAVLVISLFTNIFSNNRKETKEDYRALITEFANFKTEIRAEIASIRSEIGSIKSEIANIKVDIAKLQATTENIQRELSVMRGEISTIKEKQMEMDKELDSIRRDNERGFQLNVVESRHAHLHANGNDAKQIEDQKQKPSEKG